jgi:hypothetical protein
MQQAEHETNIFEIRAEITLLVVGSNPQHAEERMNELFRDRITQYTHPDDERPKYKVIGVVRDHKVNHIKRKVIIEKKL